MPLTQKVTFKTMLQKKNRLQIPKLVMWQCKLDDSEVLKVTVSVVNLWGSHESFVAKVQKGGRIVIPKFTIAYLTMINQVYKDTLLKLQLNPRMNFK